MKIVELVKPQQVNACTLISVAVIKAILSAKDDREMLKNITAVHHQFQTEYEVQSSTSDNGQGLLEETAYQRFSEFFVPPLTKNLQTPAENVDLTHLLTNRDGFISDQEFNFDLFYTFNFELIDSIQKKLSKDATIDWETITKKELQGLIIQDEKPSLHAQLREVLTQLEESQGITLRMDGHTTSLTKRDNTYYSFDSLTGILASTPNPEEMLAYISETIDRHKINGAIIYYFTPQRTVTPQVNRHTAEIVPLEEEFPAISAEQIHELINNRNTFDETAEGLENWQQANSELFALIIKHNSDAAILDWLSITAEQLCEFLSIAQGTSIKVKPVAPPIIEAPDYVKDENIQTLIDIVEKLKANISNQENGRKTSNNSQWKINLLNSIQENMRNPSTTDTVPQYIEAIRDVCAKKRNVLHFWSEPHSVSEFETLLQENNFQQKVTNQQDRLI